MLPDRRAGSSLLPVHTGMRVLLSVLKNEPKLVGRRVGAGEVRTPIRVVFDLSKGKQHQKDFSHV